jgi:hypothetical protein
MANYGSGHHEAWAFGMAALAAAGELAVVGSVAGFAVSAASSSLHEVPGALKSAMHRLTNFFRTNAIGAGHRRAVMAQQGAFSSALAVALEASGMAHSLIIGRDNVVLAADARGMDVVVDAILAMPEFAKMSKTVISLKPNGMYAPTALRMLTDGTAAALYADGKGVPLATVGYAEDGRPTWIFRHDGLVMDLSPAILAQTPSLAEAKASMADACETAAREYEDVRNRMLVAAEVGTHVLTENAGSLIFRNLAGKLDSPNGVPAVLSPDGQMAWAMNGTAVSREKMEELVELSGSAPRR